MPPLAPTTLRPLNEAAYRRYMRWAHGASKLIGMQLHLAGSPRSLQQGQIFLFNHFTRLETTIPPYLLHHHTGAICRSVAHEGLFKVHRAFTSFLWDGGCLPSKLPNLLPLLAAEVLRGRKVVIFPEGGLVKDKKVLDADGDYRITSNHGEAPRKHHRGAGVLALYLDIFKTFIKAAAAQADEATLKHWQAELGLSRAALVQAANLPTLVVPSTLTFFPLRSEGNIMSKLVQWLLPGLTETAVDELITETNLLFKPTDLTVHVGAPLESAWASNPTEAPLWYAAMQQVKTLPALFALELTTEAGVLAFLNQPKGYKPAALPAATFERLRDRATRALYGGLTVNIQHVIGTLVHSYYTQGRTTVPAPEFEAALVWATYRLQQQAAKSPALSLHESTGTAQSLLHLALGTHHYTNAFMASLKRAKLVKRKTLPHGAVYHLSARLGEGLGRDEIRLENPVQLHVNEAATQPAVPLAVRWAQQQAAEMAAGHTAPWGLLLLEVERRAAHAAYTAAGAQGLAAGAYAVAPFLLTPSAPNGRAVVLLHGLGATPAQVRPFAEDLAGQGFTVYAPRLPGHGAKPEDLYATTYAEWLATGRLALNALQALGHTHIQVVGFSTGGVAALNLATEKHPALQQIIALAPALQLVKRRRHLLPLGIMLNALIRNTVGRFIPRLRLGVIPWYNMAPPNPTEQYSRVPLHAVRELLRMAKRATRVAHHITTPVQVLHGTADATAAFTASQAYASKVQGATFTATFTALAGAPHDCLRTNLNHSWATLSALLNQPATLAKAPTDAPR